MKAFTTLLTLFLSFSLFAKAPQLEEIIVRLQPENQPKVFFDNFITKHNLTKVQYIKTISVRYQLSILEFDANLHNKTNLIDLLSKEEAVVFATISNKATLRTTPNDPGYSDQWHMETIKAPEVWEFTTGGVTPLGDTIVIAQMEGIEITHEDLKDNIWRNHLEIPDNGIDDDNNSYTDDYLGYNSETGNDDHLASNHGTRVAGIIGAKGNNGTGVTGVNWDTKLMVVSNKLGPAEIIAAYEYVLKMREDYNNSDGEKGAFVVSTNASFGFTNFINDDPLFGIWCELMNDLGNAGILSVSAAINEVDNIERIGDVPSLCPSDYLITVTNLDEAGTLHSGYSSTYIDLSAPGEGSFSTGLNNSYRNINGASAAAPHVAGAVGLLYSAPCEKFAELSKTNPAEAALTLKSMILNGVHPRPELANKTVSGGQLNLENSYNLLKEFCGQKNGALDILSLSPNPVQNGQELTVDIQTPDEGIYQYKIIDALGRLIYKSSIDIIPFEPNIIQLKTQLTPGVYFFTIENNQDRKAESFLVY